MGTDPEITQMIESVDKNVETVFITIFHMYHQNVEENMKRTQTELLEMKKV